MGQSSQHLRHLLGVATVVALASTQADGHTPRTHAHKSSSHPPHTPSTAVQPPVKAAPKATSMAAMGVEDVAVTATKQSQSVSKVPMSIGVLSKAQMDIMGVRTAADVATRTPGFDISTVANPTGGGQSSGGATLVSIRGISSTNGDATTGLYIDDTAIQVRNTLNGVSGSTFPRVFDLDRVEVERGPQGTLFGAGAEGGAVRFITPQPSLTRYTGYARSEVSGTVNGGPSYEAGGAVGGPIIRDKLGFRVSAWTRTDGGYVDRQNWETGALDRNSNWQNTQAYKAALTFAPVEWFRLTPSVYYQYQHSNDTSVYWTTLSDRSTGRLINGSAVQLPYTDKFVLPALKAELGMGPVSLDANASYFIRSNVARADETNSEYAADGFGLYYPRIANGLVTSPLFNKTNQTVATTEVRMHNTNSHNRLNWMLGLFYSDNHQQDREAQEDDHLNDVLAEYGQTSLGYFGENPIDGKYPYVAKEVTDEYQLAGYGNVSYRITKSITASAGVRVSRTRLAYSVQGDGPGNGGPSLFTGNQAATPVTPRFSLSWQVDRNNMLYTTVAKGFRIGGVNPSLPQALCASDLSAMGLSQAPQKYGSDSLWSYEIGAKDRLFGGRVQIETSAYHIDWSQIQQKVVLPTCTFAFTENAGSATSNGFDVKVTARVVPQVLLGLAFGYTDAYYNDTLHVGRTIAVKAGDTLGQTPWDVIASVEYDFTLFRAQDSYVRLENIFHSRNNGPYTYQHTNAYSYDPTIGPNPAINMVNIRMGTRFHGIDLSVFCNNLLNSQPRLAYGHATTTSPVYFATTLTPLTAGLTAIYRF